eukprot:TRINITY_DN62002_c0_g1_i3.p1 TRINITY_DN62002_c0_g1~~TRINITY_DN62002_c0_g1_i3.p1  ORF type:complete len:495 (-),score=205.28 TRINITY_DN62002_c0_g1_i3:36-1484(-)
MSSTSVSSSSGAPAAPAEPASSTKTPSTATTATTAASLGVDDRARSADSQGTNTTQPKQQQQPQLQPELQPEQQHGSGRRSSRNAVDVLDIEHLKQLFWKQFDMERALAKLKAAQADRRKRLQQRGSKLKSQVKGEYEKLEQNIRSQADKIKAKLRAERTRLKKQQLKLNTAFELHVRLIDKIGFFMGVVCSWITVFLLGWRPYLLLPWCASWIVVLFFVRWAVYWYKKWHYFVFDFCYFANVLLVTYMYAYPHSRRFFNIVFALNNGPLLWAIVFWRNCLVFHHLDKITSLFIHIGGVLCTFTIRWLSFAGDDDVQGPSLVSPDYDAIHSMRATFESLTWYQAIVSPVIVYMVWQTGYFLKTEFSVFRITSSTPVADDDSVMTSFKWLEKGSLGWLVNNRHVRPEHKVYFFMLYQLIFTFITLLPVKLMFDSFAVHVGVIVLVIACSVWNGASYYFEVVVKRYEPNYKQRREAALEKRKEQ